MTEMETIEHTHEARKAYAERFGGFKEVPNFRGDGIIQTYSGGAYDFADPTPDMISFHDIAHALSNMCRFAGHVKRFYSVAEHSVLVSYLVAQRTGDLELAVAGLFHDAHEAYVWDAPRPFKPLLGEDFRHFADLADSAIARRFGLNPAAFHAPAVKDADDHALVTEARQLMHHGTDGWGPEHQRRPSATAQDILGYGGELEPDLGRSTPDEAKRIFIGRAVDLGVLR